MQTTKNILLIRPSNFIFNAETAASNPFQIKLNESEEAIKQKAFDEFETFATTLKSKGVNVFIFDDTKHPEKPDAIFPNNWITFHSDGTVVLYPMFANNIRQERRSDILDSLKKHFKINHIVDLSKYENDKRFLEGTGSMVFDHINKIAYACLSPRTDKELFLRICHFLKYKSVFFHSRDKNDKEIYHTNVMMSISEKFSIICLDSISDEQEKILVSNSLTETGHRLINISFEQMNNFAGNMIVVQTNSDKNILVLSQSAFSSLTDFQKKEIEKFCDLTPIPIKTIETIGGGSARCMIAEIFLEPLGK